MKRFIKSHPWKIIVDEFRPELHPLCESLMSIGNGRMGQRANFPEKYSGESLQGSYIAGVYYPDKTRVGWWKNGYPEYFAKVLNSVNWIGIKLIVNGDEVDLNQVRIISYYRELDMKAGLLRRKMIISPEDGLELKIITERFYSIANQDQAFLHYSVKVVKGKCSLRLSAYLDFNIRNSDSNYEEDFWENRVEGIENGISFVRAETGKTNFTVACAMSNKSNINGKSVSGFYKSDGGMAWETFDYELSIGDIATLDKHVSIISSLYYNGKFESSVMRIVKDSFGDDYKSHKAKQASSWEKRWEGNDIVIKGDDSAQQGIRFNIFQLYQTYSGEDPRLNIGPKGFTGEKYGGSTYWDTEAYCLPFYMSTASQEVAKNLLVYRYRHLEKAKENAALLGFNRGAALYPMVTMNGEECHNEWEITFEEIHRNGAIAYAIFDYIRYTGDENYLTQYGLDVLIGIARFWSQRVNWSNNRSAYVILGVTGPNEYENNVNNNWYTNYIARWCLSYTLECLDHVEKSEPNNYKLIALKNKLDYQEDQKKWKDIVENMFLPDDKDLGIFLQQDGYLDKDDYTVQDLKEADRPINQNWSWDRILRSPYIKQADVLQGIYFFEEAFDLETIRRNYNFYEPRTVHESSLSPCVHSILAARLGYNEKAYEMYLRTARLDLDDYNSDTEDGCHITSMAGTWMSIIEGFAGMQVKKDVLQFDPFIPEQWDGYAFRIDYRGRQLEVNVTQSAASYTNLGGTPITLELNAELIELPPNGSCTIDL